MFLQCFPSKHGNLHMCHHKSVPKHHFLQCFQFPCLPKPLKTPLFTLFSSIFPCANAAGQLKHIYKNNSKTLVFYNVGPKHWFLQCFQCFGIQKPFKISLFTVFFIFVRFSIAGSLPNDPKFHFNTLLSSDTQNHRKISQTPPNSGLCAKSFLPPPS